MREVKVIKARPKTIKCRRCRCVTLTLVRKAWKKNPLRDCTELRGHYECKNCGFTSSKVFATEPI